MTREEIIRPQASTAEYKGRDWDEEFRETFRRIISKVEIDPLKEVSFDAEMNFRMTPDVGMAARVEPTSDAQGTKVSDGDEVVLIAVQAGAGCLKQGGREITVRSGEAVLLANDEPANFAALMSTTVVNIRLSRTVLANDVAYLDAVVARVIPGDRVALRLLIGYSSLLDDKRGLATAGLRRAFVTHMHDLAALALGGAGDAAEIPKMRGLRAARLRGIKADIMRNMTQADLSIDAVALRQGLSRSYVSQLMAAEGTTFTDFVLDRRLKHAYRMLTSWRYAECKISEIAFASGISDLSYFNRTFRRRYGLTPSDVRARAWSICRDD
jgi:AraC-like DNA-binding protein